MADTNHPVGTIIGDETYAVQDTAGAAFLANLPPGYINLPLDQQKPIVAALAKLMAELAGRVITSHVLPWEPVYAAPNQGDGLDRPMPAVCQQFDSPETGSHVALWLKTGTLPTNWAIFEGSVDDHEVKADSSDTGHGALIDKSVAGAGMSLAVVNVGGVLKVQFTCTVVDDHLVKARNADATTVGGLMEKTIDSPTIERTLTVDGDGVEVVAFNTLAQADPISFESTLYAAHLDDPVWRGNVKCVFGLHGCQQALFSYQSYSFWEEIRPGVWKSKIDFDFSGSVWFDNIEVAPGDLVLAFDPALPEEDWPRTGIYVVRSSGGASGPAVLERVDYADSASDLEAGLVVFCQNGEYFGGKYYRLTTTAPIVLETTPLYWEVLTSYELVSSDNLLNAAQLARASDTPNTTALVASVGSPSDPLDFPTLAGTPNLDTYKAGRTEVHALARLHIAGSAGSITWLECQVIRDMGGTEVVLETISTSPVTNTADEIIKAHVDDDEDQDLAGGRIGLRIVAKSDSTTPAAIAVTWSDPAHSTRLLTPMTLAVGGSDDHYGLTPESRGYVAGEEADARKYPHPIDSLRPGLITWNTGPDVATVDGLLTLPPHTNAVRISGTDTLLGIATAGMTPGTVIYVETSASRMIRNGGVTPEGYAAFDFHKALGFSASSWAFLAPDNAAMVLGLSGSSNWRVLSAPWVEPQRSLWPATCAVTINTTDATGLLELPAGCPGVVYVTGTALRAITVDDADGNAQAGPLASLKLHFMNDCRLYHDDPLSGWDAGLAARAAKLNLLPPEDAEGDDRDWSCKAKRTMRLVLNTLDTPRTWIREIDQ